MGFTTCTAAITGTRRQLPLLVSRLNAAINGLGRTDDLELQIAESADSAAVFSSLRITEKNRDRQVLDFLVRTHAELLDRFPEHSVPVDGSSGGLTVSGVTRDYAARAAQLLIAWWEELRAADLQDWPGSDLTLGIGVTAEEPEVSYVVERGDPDEDDDAGAVPVPMEQNRQEAGRAVAAWSAGLEDLGALLQAGLRPGYAARLTFAARKFKPRVVVEELESGDEDEDGTAELPTAIRFRNPMSRVKG